MYRLEDLSVLNDQILIPSDPNIIKNQVTELHIYSFYGDYVSGNHNAGYTRHEKTTNSLLTDIGGVFKAANINRGSYVVVLNVLQNVWGNLNDESVLVQEISPDRTEIQFKIISNGYDQFQQQIAKFRQQQILNNLVVNFGFNQLQKIVNIRFENDTFYVKLYQPIYDDITNRSKAWFQYEVIDPYVDTVILTTKVGSGAVNVLRGPNFDIDVSLYSSSPTSFKNWDELLDSDALTSQKIIDKALSGSGTINLNIDYTSFDNFIFYSSAVERAKNYHYKVSKLEEYSSSVAILLSSTASNTPFISSSIDLNTRRMDQITTNFDPWERWLYYHPTSSIFTHDFTGSLTPHPKRLVSGKWANYTISSSIVQNWYNTLLYSASEYDKDNVNRLYWSIPEHIYMEPGNSNLVLFVDMLGQHFDTIYSYVKAHTQIHERDEHPERGTPSELLYPLAKSYGWQLQNTRQLSNLAKYKLGTDRTGSFAQTGTLFSQREEMQTHQIWKRIVNNLPFLLKTKGTPRSLKALMSIYGIPQTLLSIREYGGTSPSNGLPSLIEDRFQYALNFSGSQYVKLPRRRIPASSGSYYSGSTRVPDTIEFRFRTNYSSSVSMSLWGIENNVTSGVNLLELVHITASQSTPKYSGSYAYGYLRYSGHTVNAFGTDIQVKKQSEPLPLFDNDFWTVQIKTLSPITLTNNTLEWIYINVKRQSDSLYGRITHTGSIAFSGSRMRNSWGNFSSYDAGGTHYVILGGTTGSSTIPSPISANRFVGQMQGYKEWYEVINTSSFDQHVLNPAAYHGNDPTSSFNTLFRYFPLGLDQQRWDHSVYQLVSSSQPNRRASLDTTASFVGFTGSQSEQYKSSVETYYVTPPTLGGNVLRSDKIRLEDTALLRDLSPTNRSTVGAFDKASFDSNRLAVVFSPTEHVDRDIYNHTGFAELDDYIGDPEYVYESEYGELKQFAYHYFKKYQQANNINDLIEILSAYDYTFFEQIKQLVPGRADLVAGILIEPTVLERSKVQAFRRPQIENPQYDMDVAGIQPTTDAEVQQIESSASYSPKIASRYNYITGSVPYTVFATGSSLSHFNTSSKQLTMDVDTIPTRYSGSQSPTQSYIDGTRLNCCYKKVIFHYSASGQFATKYEKQWYTAVSKSYGMYYSKSLECGSYQNYECSSRFMGSKLEGPAFNVNSNQTADGGPVVTIWESDPNKLSVNDSPLGGGIRVE